MVVWWIPYELLGMSSMHFLKCHLSMQVAKARDVGVNSVVLFPKVPDALKVLILHPVSFLNSIK